jgi:hypothetical protein
MKLITFINRKSESYKEDQYMIVGAMKDKKKLRGSTRLEYTGSNARPPKKKTSFAPPTAKRLRVGAFNGKKLAGAVCALSG